MGRGSEDQGSQILYGKTTPRRLKPEPPDLAPGEQFELRLLVELRDSRSGVISLHEVEAGPTLRQWTQAGIHEVARNNWQHPLLKQALRQQADSDQAAREVLEIAEAHPHDWTCRLDSASAETWCKKHRVPIR